MRFSTSASRLLQVGATAGFAAVIAATPVMAAGPVKTGPSSSQSPYILPAADGVKITSILTVGDQANGYSMVGIPDGIGLLKGEHGFQLFLNHELQPADGIGRASGGTGGAFVSDWTIGKNLAVKSGHDLSQTIYFWNGSSYETRTGAAANIGRFCSGDLAERNAYWDPTTKTGFRGRILLNGEETGDEGRAFAHVVSGSAKGNSYELPALGNTSFENLLASPASGLSTVVIANDDSTPGQVYVYVGTKQNTGSPVERAGLTNGQVYGVRVPSAPTVTKTVDSVSYSASVEDRTAGIGGSSAAFELASLGNVTSWSGAKLQGESIKAGVTEFLRPEDGAWDPSHPNDYYFVTTDRFDTVQTPTSNGVANTPASQVGNSRLWRLRFADVKNPALGGTVEMLLDGTEGQQMMDNITVDRTGHVIIQEDPGNQAYLSRMWSYAIGTDTLSLIAEVDPSRFQLGEASFLTKDEETSGIIDASRILGPGWFVGTVQAHYAIGGELVEGGQLFALYSPTSDPRHHGHEDHHHHRI